MGPPKATASTTPVTQNVQTFGAKIDPAAAKIALADATKHKGEKVVTEGRVTKVCQERGCWLALKDSSTDAVVRMHGHSFFVPTTSSGKHARVAGTVMLMKDGKECDEMEAANAQLEIDATGVELD
ncbi:MAG TPA: DUF4920 domain-containing protein [Polyangiaceae bacterium]